MVVAYLVVEKLSGFQLCLINSLYVLSDFTVLLSNYGSVLDSATARTKASRTVCELVVIMGFDAASPTFLAAMVTGINTLFILISLLFMWQVRNPQEVKVG